MIALQKCEALRTVIGKSLMGIAMSITTLGGAAAADMQFTSVPGHGEAPLNVMEMGNPAGPEILFIHGMGMSYLSFRPQYESDLPNEFRIVAMDLRGHGASAKPWRVEDVRDTVVWADDVAAVIKAKNLKKPVIVAWSFGGFVTADYVRKYGKDGLAGINLVGSIAGLVAQPPPSANLPPEEMKRRSAMQTSGNLADNLTVVAATTKLFEFPGITPAYRDEMYAFGVMLPSYFRKAFMGMNLDHQDVTPKLAGLPMLVTMGDRDVAQSPEAFGRLKAALSWATFSEYPDTGHLPFAQRTERFNAELAEFVRSVNR